ncbi:lipopolysaccharide transport periplasmic protein LptA [Actibacterium mucosum]|uniref:lipopolysaccharide transport periplasmic protein LptA n=1 Tax=Actibacterium mucosum TaxID=1087332 RepID=UPI001F0046AA|nr:lipopolysaccharide transport periplasmic protein LptA [Actibacterium mucosum]
MSGLTAGAALAQGAQVAFGGLKQDASLPVEVTADSLEVNQADGSAVFTGNVLIGQGEMRLSADKVRVEYNTSGGIDKMHAMGKVLLVSGGEAAEANEAVYTIETASIVMTGSVILTQGDNALSGQTLTVDLASGTGRMEGRVSTVFNPSSAKE